jgi:hypothetical protein
MQRKKIIIDIDGTIAKPGDRLKFIQGPNKDWDAFYEACFDDEPIMTIIELIRLLNRSYELVFCTGRRESVRTKTADWLLDHVYLNGGAPTECMKAKLLMRANNDYRHDAIVKPELLKNAGIEVTDVAFILEDRNAMVTKWRELGFTCLQVADGDF